MTPADVTVAARPILRLAATAPPAATSEPNVRVAVLDTSWDGPGAAAGEGPIALRRVAERVLERHDLIVEAVEAMNGWVEATGIVDAMTDDGTSYWYYARLGHWMWLQQQIVWVAIVDELVREVRPSEIVCGAGSDEAAIQAARLVAARDGIGLEIETGQEGATPGGLAPGPVPPAPPSEATLRQRVDHLRLRLLGRIRQPDPGRARRFVRRRLNRLAREPGRLLVVLEHARQRVETPGGPRFLNPYLGPVVERLRGTRLEPIEIDIRLRLAVESTWLRLNEWDSDRLLPVDAVWLAGDPWPSDDCDRRAAAIADRIEAASAPVPVAGVDLGPALTARVASEARRSLVSQLRGATRNRALIRKLKPAGILLADEYHRQAWLAAAAAEGVPTAAVQHGMIYRWHNGYVHTGRPPALRLPDRTYVFGRWERQILVDQSVYRDDEVVVGGSPRLDLVPTPSENHDDVRAMLGVADGYRLVVVSGTWGQIYRRFHYPVGLAAIFDRHLPRVHVVVKLHPGEPDEGPYGAVIEGVARQGGFEPPPISVVQSIDLYRLLAAADAHIGVHSTVLTEAVAAGTANLLIDGPAGGDLLGYVEAGVAHPIRTGADLLDALEHGRGRADDAARSAFLAAHFEPGNASERIANDLLAWL